MPVAASLEDTIPAKSLEIVSMALGLPESVAIDHSPKQTLSQLQLTEGGVKVSCKVAQCYLHQNYNLIESEIKMADFFKFLLCFDMFYTFLSAIVYQIGKKFKYLESQDKMINLQATSLCSII